MIEPSHVMVNEIQNDSMNHHNSSQRPFPIPFHISPSFLTSSKIGCELNVSMLDLHSLISLRPTCYRSGSLLPSSLKPISPTSCCHLDTDTRSSRPKYLDWQVLTVPNSYLWVPLRFPATASMSLLCTNLSALMEWVAEIASVRIYIKRPILYFESVI